MKKSLFTFILITISGLIFAQQSIFPENTKISKGKSTLQDSVYLMAFFNADSQHLHYAYSNDARTWVDINNANPVFNAYDDAIWMRDPYLKRVTQHGVTKYHLVHTWGWDNPSVFHWESTDLIHWTGTNGGKTTEDGKIAVMDGNNGNGLSKNAWAPEFTYVQEVDSFYIYWSSDRGDGYLRHFYCTTRDWKTFSPSKLFFDPGYTNIDMTILKYKELYYAFYKAEGVQAGKIRVAISKNLNPAIQRFSGTTDVLPGYTTPSEGPEVFKSIGENKWYLYWDKFVGDNGVSYATSDNPSILAGWSIIPDIQIANPTKVKHGSVEIISSDELTTILNFYNVKTTVILPTSDLSAQSWKYTITTPALNWYSSDFNDSGWATGNGGFGSVGTPSARIGTQWTNDDIWIRNSFNPGSLTADELNKLTIKIFYDEGAEVYINGILALTVTGYLTGYVLKDLSIEAKSSILNNSINSIAVHCHQTTGGQFIDVGLQTVTPLIISELPKYNEDSFNIFPSPALDKLSVTSSFNLIGSNVKITDTNGAQVFNCQGTNDVDVSFLKSGVYIFTLITKDNKRYSKSFVKQ